MQTLQGREGSSGSLHRPHPAGQRAEHRRQRALRAVAFEALLPPEVRRRAGGIRVDRPARQREGLGELCLERGRGDEERVRPEQGVAPAAA